MFGDSLLIVFISICTALMGEGRCLKHISRRISLIITNVAGLTWVLVYRTEKYQKLKGEVEKQSKKCKLVLNPLNITYKCP